MGLQSGPPLSDTRPLIVEYDEVGRPIQIGNHVGSGEALNVKNPKPGYHYGYPRSSPSDIQRFLMDGWEYVSSEDQERWGADLPANVQAELGTSRVYKDVVLMRIKDELYAKIQAAKAESARLAREGIDREFEERGREIAAALGGRSGANRGPLYSRHANHGYDIEEG